MNNFEKDSFVKESLICNSLKELTINLQIHKSNSRNILIIYPGASGSIDGYNNKYKKIAQLIKSKNIATVIQMDNNYYFSSSLTYGDLMIDKIAQVIEYVDNNSKKLTGYNQVNFYLAGVSASAGAMATISGGFPQIKKMLFIAPALSVGIENIKRGLQHYEGELYLTAGENDEIKAFNSAKTYHDISERALKKELVIIPECDHQFRGERNGKIMANAFLWAFSEKSNFPSHRGGITLYE